MTTKTLTLTTDEIEDIRFCLELVAQIDKGKAISDISEPWLRALDEQADRRRTLARKITS